MEGLLLVPDGFAPEEQGRQRMIYTSSSARCVRCEQ
ncbi:hypothetical protein GQ55_3G263600 [Panicum hallii var. hallii]|uniref:Uncharacterized protein n=1 Tax=Panicum hallii var. hallii TaxID=1504633 RepID=A0A2T7EDK4_9POAL|nr:hypothetical protein GQ55_3G263600 [Panicum hallii var. hallii]